MAVEVAGERYFTVQTHNITLSVTCLRKGQRGNPPLTTPPSLPMPQSPKRSATFSRMSFDSRPGVNVSAVGAWMRRWACDWSGFGGVVADGGEGHDEGSG